MNVTITSLNSGVLSLVVETDANSEPDLVLSSTAGVAGNVILEPQDASGARIGSVAVPSDCLNDGVSTLIIHQRESPDVLAQMTVLAGQAAPDDLIAEVALLRAEIELLKGVMRRNWRG